MGRNSIVCPGRGHELRCGIQPIAGCMNDAGMTETCGLLLAGWDRWDPELMLLGFGIV